MYNDYRLKMDKLYTSDSTLIKNFKNNVFAALAINCSKHVNSEGHTDNGNRPDGWCAITAVGNFNHRTSGHIVLDELKLIIEFPRGSSVYIPSAIVTHHTIPIQAGETRHSMTQYTGGGLFRWIYNGFCSDKDWLLNATDADLEKREIDRAARWEEGLKFFPVI